MDAAVEKTTSCKLIGYPVQLLPQLPVVVGDPDLEAFVNERGLAVVCPNIGRNRPESRSNPRQTDEDRTDCAACQRLKHAPELDRRAGRTGPGLLDRRCDQGPDREGRPRLLLDERRARQRGRRRYRDLGPKRVSASWPASLLAVVPEPFTRRPTPCRILSLSPGPART
jgi:hypothetical protein